MATQTKRPVRPVKKTERNQDVRWSNVSGKMRLWGREVENKNGGTFYTYSTSIGSKNEDGEFENIYFNVRFVKDTDPLCEGAIDIEIKRGFLTVTKDRDGKLYPTVMVLEYVFFEEQ